MSVDTTPPLALRATLPKLHDRRTLPGLDREVSPFCLGMVADPKIIPAAFDAGVNFFFLSGDKSWHFFEKARRGLAMLLERGNGVRDDIVVCVATYLAQPEYNAVPFHDVLAALPTLQRIDLPILGGVREADLYERLQTMRRTTSESSIGPAVGATFMDAATAFTSVDHDLVDLAITEHNSVARGARDLFPRRRADAKCLLFGHSTKNGAPTPERYAALGLDAESWIPGPVDHYRYALSFRGLDGVLFAMGGVDYLEELVAGLEAGPLDAEEIEYMSGLGDVVAGRASLDDAPGMQS